MRVRELCCQQLHRYLTPISACLSNVLMPPTSRTLASQSTLGS